MTPNRGAERVNVPQHALNLNTAPVDAALDRACPVNEEPIRKKCWTASRRGASETV